MKYIIMCGTDYSGLDTPKQMFVINHECLVERTIRLLRENGVTDISISTEDVRFDRFGVPLIIPKDLVRKCWIDGAFPTVDDEPVCYVLGDVFFSPAAIKTIVETETDDVMFFASRPPFHHKYPKKYAEPFAFKVTNIEHFREAVEKTRTLWEEGVLRRCISWELWQVVKGTRLNRIDYTNYVAINDYTCDVDTKAQAEELDTQVRMYGLLQEE